MFNCLGRVYVTGHVEIEFTNTTRFPALANRRIRWFFECGWWYHQSSPPKQMRLSPFSIGGLVWFRDSTRGATPLHREGR